MAVVQMCACPLLFVRTLEDIQDPEYPGRFLARTPPPSPSITGEDKINEWQRQDTKCWCAKVAVAKKIDLTVTTYLPKTRTIHGEVAIAEGALSDIMAHEKRRRVVYETGYNAYYKETQLSERWPLKCGTVCRATGRN
jgi:hypothetical protein